MAENLRKRHQKAVSTRSSKAADDMELVGASTGSMMKMKRNATDTMPVPMLSGASRFSKTSVSGFLPEGPDGSDELLQDDEDEEVCSRCMGSGYLTCMACN